MGALLQKVRRRQRVCSHGTFFWVKVQFFPGLLAAALCNCHIQCLVTGPVQLASGTAPWASIWGSWECWRHTKPHQGLLPVRPILLGGEGARESTMALGFSGCEEGGRFIWMWVFCALCEASEGTMRTFLLLHCGSVPQLWGCFPGWGFPLGMDQGDVMGFIENCPPRTCYETSKD